MNRFVNPSRDDATDLNRREKCSLLYLMNVVSAFMDAKEDLKERAESAGCYEGLCEICEKGMQFLTDIRTTVPEKQRMHLNNTAHEYELRLIPKLTPSTTCVVLGKEEFREIVDAAQAKCHYDCTKDVNEAKDCYLYKLLVMTLPMDYYPDTGNCPYITAEWGN